MRWLSAVSAARPLLVGTALLVSACGPSSQAGPACDPACAPGLSCVDGVCTTDTGPCNPGDVESCYTGPTGTAGVGVCQAGSHTCSASGVWGNCDGQVVPGGEVCGNGADDNCNGSVDEDVDSDGDGFTTCGGDCCDSTGDGCQNPAAVNPGAFEVAGNQVDDDCDGMVDNATAANCDTGLTSNSTDPMDYARAMELCQMATGDKWGVVSAQLVLPSGSGAPNADQRSIRPNFGGTAVESGQSFVVLSTGHAASTGQINPSFAAFQGGQDLGGSSTMPSDWLAANGGTLPNAPGCPAPNGGTTAHDPVMLELKIRVPTNAKSFRMSTNFFSAEYPEWVCSAFNDFFVVLLDSTWNGTPANPADKNLAVYTSPTMQQYPVGVNLAYGNTGLFTVCENGDTGCATTSGAVPGTINTCVSTAELIGTGMDTANPAPQFASDPGYCGANNLAGGGTGWLVTQGNVVGGEEITLRIALWDTSDGWYDSVALIDNFQWSLDASDPGTVVN